ncbi:SagB/ThcOx family dehydrogenase [Methylocapsa sp. D3K7]|uniref:SagB/ThcOx family dehydrogenase n=1 Tax=Methylocapsa sp. D3K7 TaxID=3041435 RepID=UPI00244EE474|nr:SagB/ThcOx family dehydrogenase [Methylocapsa sp. D3K7]WGJ13163.1 SagB/ThcOx family dehydrogenase [Methylocapsa sp. D3K7]
MTHAADPGEITLTYHARTKHRVERYAAGPETLDWDAQPNPFREFNGCPRIALPFAAGLPETRFAEIYRDNCVEPVALTLASVSVLIELSLGLSAWKQYGPDRWALRCNPSSGNLHPTEAYLLTSQVPGLEDGLYHYFARDHALEQRCRHTATPGQQPAQLWIGLTSIHWREAWKYGERGFRYCQLDIGHALGALRYAAGMLGWTARIVDQIEYEELTALLGLDRTGDFLGAEQEEPDLLIAIDSGPATNLIGSLDRPCAAAARAGEWTGRANLLDPHPMYRWPVIEQVSLATRGEPGKERLHRVAYPPLPEIFEAHAASIIQNRRSAQRFDSKQTMSAGTFFHMLDCLLDRPAAPWDIWAYIPRVHPIFFVHRVEGLEAGLYLLHRDPEALRALRDTLNPDFIWQTLENAPAHLPLIKLMPGDCRSFARTVSCYQAIACDSCFSLGMLAEFEAIVKQNSWRYRQLHWEAGLLGHVLYLEAEAAGLRGTGIGCYFDDVLHELLGIKNERFQSFYHFTVGYPLKDERITTLPAYPGRSDHH